VQPWCPRRTSCPALPLPSTGVAPLLRYYEQIRHPWAHRDRSSFYLCFPYSSYGDPHGLPVFLHPSLSRHATLSDPGRFSGAVALSHAYCCLPGLAPGRHLLNVGSIASLTLRPAYRSVYASWWVVTFPHARLDSRWLARPCRKRNRTSWMDEAYLGARQVNLKAGAGRSAWCVGSGE